MSARRTTEVNSAGFSRWTICVVSGSSCRVTKGSVSTISAPGLHRPEFFSNTTTAILGGDEDDPAFDMPTTAEWFVPVPKEVLGSVQVAYLLIGCNRFFGGLHSHI